MARANLPTQPPALAGRVGRRGRVVGGRVAAAQHVGLSGRDEAQVHADDLGAVAHGRARHGRWWAPEGGR